MNFDLTWGEEGPVNHSDHRAVGLATLDACRDAGNSWLFPDAGPAWNGIKAIYVAASGNPTYFVDTTATIEAGIALKASATASARRGRSASRARAAAPRPPSVRRRLGIDHKRPASTGLVVSSMSCP